MTQKVPRRRQAKERGPEQMLPSGPSELKHPTNTSTLDLSSFQHCETTNFCGVSHSECVVLRHGSPRELIVTIFTEVNTHLTSTVCRTCTRRWGEYKRNQQKPPHPCRANNSFENKACMCTHNIREKSGDERRGCLKGSKVVKRNETNFICHLQ